MPAKRKKSRSGGVSLAYTIDPNAAGIDIGATEIYFAVPVDRDLHPVRRFATFPEDLMAAADWLQHCGIKTVAMESTGVYWIPLFQILEAREMKVCPGRIDIYWAARQCVDTPTRPSGSTACTDSSTASRRTSRWFPRRCPPSSGWP